MTGRKQAGAGGKSLLFGFMCFLSRPCGGAWSEMRLMSQWLVSKRVATLALSHWLEMTTERPPRLPKLLRALAQRLIKRANSATKLLDVRLMGARATPRSYILVRYHPETVFLGQTLRSRLVPPRPIKLGSHCAVKPLKTAAPWTACKFWQHVCAKIK
ncbi:hypothetical protein BDZ88DRAFT_475212 [Geranomyces variabilis]|nr:hypothetical protein BDZ88DRAFT_475212 [Geranomyces variabilis]